MNVLLWLVIYLVVVNLLGFSMMGIDKSRARRRAWRIPEAHLIIVALIGGSVGAILGMWLFRHKTRHWYFAYGLPVILVLQIAVVIALILSPLQISLF
ncbi:MAG: DUF1294 domain-containing protein [Lachnospiraceae bacterium]|nr:DUF1294 domain-containing protein [Lachnospiraceae bacterium]MCR4595471.1 DUF1294 domain-containing protein [Lachnospiraceae bacterium]